MGSLYLYCYDEDMEDIEDTEDIEDSQVTTHVLFSAPVPSSVPIVVIKMVKL